MVKNKSYCVFWPHTPAPQKRLTLCTPKTNPNKARIWFSARIVESVSEDDETEYTFRLFFFELYWNRMWNPCQRTMKRNTHSVSFFLFLQKRIMESV